MLAVAFYLLLFICLHTKPLIFRFPLAPCPPLSRLGSQWLPLSPNHRSHFPDIMRDWSCLLLSPVQLQFAFSRETQTYIAWAWKKPLSKHNSFYFAKLTIQITIFPLELYNFEWTTLLPTPAFFVEKFLLLKREIILFLPETLTNQLIQEDSIASVFVKTMENLMFHIHTILAKWNLSSFSIHCNWRLEIFLVALFLCLRFINLFMLIMWRLQKQKFICIPGIRKVLKGTLISRQVIFHASLNILLKNKCYRVCVVVFTWHPYRFS